MWNKLQMKTVSTDPAGMLTLLADLVEMMKMNAHEEK